MSRSAAEWISNRMDSSLLLEELQSDEQGFLVMSKRIKKLTGIHLPVSAKNLSLVAGRLHSIIRGYGLGSYLDYDRFLAGNDAARLEEFVSAITTNTTQFFREEAHYKFLQSILPGLLERKRKQGETDLRVWCAASSTGQEPYSLVMTIRQTLAAYPGINLRFLASDIDLEVLETASRGVYSRDDLKSLPPLLRQRWVRELEGGAGEMSPVLRNSIRFARFNLQTERWPFQHPFDIIFCRNVLIYFDRETCARIVDNMAKVLRPGGHLFLGHSESGMLRGSSIELVGNAVAQKKTA